MPAMIATSVLFLFALAASLLPGWTNALLPINSLSPTSDIDLYPSKNAACNMRLKRGFCGKDDLRQGWDEEENKEYVAAHWPQYVRWHYDSEVGHCRKFNYSGCHGNSNRFLKEEQCEQQCEDWDREDFASRLYYLAFDKCGEWPATSGRLEGGDPAGWYYDSDARHCSSYAGGLTARSSNNFASEEECEQRCTDNHRRGKKSRIDPFAPYSRDHTSVCSAEPRAEECPAGEKDGAAWYYDVELGRCAPLTPGGCGDSTNRFDEKEACDKKCDSGPTVLYFEPCSVVEHKNCKISEHCRELSKANDGPVLNRIKGAVAPGRPVTECVPNPFCGPEAPCESPLMYCQERARPLGGICLRDPTIKTSTTTQPSTNTTAPQLTTIATAAAEPRATAVAEPRTTTTTAETSTTEEPCTESTITDEPEQATPEESNTESTTEEAEPDTKSTTEEPNTEPTIEELEPNTEPTTTKEPNTQDLTLTTIATAASESSATTAAESSTTTEEPCTESTTAEEPEPDSESTTIEQPNTELETENTTEEHDTEQTSTGDPNTNESDTESISTDEPATEQTTNEEPDTQSTTGELKPNTFEPATTGPTTTDEPNIEPDTEPTTTNEPATQQTTTAEQTITGEPEPDTEPATIEEQEHLTEASFSSEQAISEGEQTTTEAKPSPTETPSERPLQSKQRSSHIKEADNEQVTTQHSNMTKKSSRHNRKLRAKAKEAMRAWKEHIETLRELFSSLSPAIPPPSEDKYYMNSQ